MPAHELLALAERWRRDPSGAVRDGELLTATRAAFATLDGSEREAIGRELRAHGQANLASRVERSDRLPVWSAELTEVARELLTVDEGTLADLRGAVDPDAVSSLTSPPVGAPIDLPPPAAEGPSEPAWSELAPPTGPSEPAGGDDADAGPQEVELSAEEVRELRSGAGSDYEPGADAPWRYRTLAERTAETDAAAPPAADDGDAAHGGEGADDVGTDHAPDAWDDAEHPDGSAGWQDDATGDEHELAPAASSPPAAHRSDRHAEPTFAPGTRDTTTARERFAELATLEEHADVRDLIAAAPDGWQRRRLVLRALDAGAPLPRAEVLLTGLARPSDRATVADRLVRAGYARLEEVRPYLTPGAVARLTARHARPATEG